ncbi:MAG: winged helix-turn-helix transcriptional regulator [Promethearchaeota archaeon]
MDPLDKKLLWELHENCRVSYQNLSQILGISANAVKKRVAKLIDTGVIYKFSAMLSLDYLQSEVLYALVYTDGYENTDEFIKNLGSNPMVHVVGSIASGGGGAYNFFAQYIGSQGLAELGRFVRTLDHVTRTELFPLLIPKDHRGVQALPIRGKEEGGTFSKTELKVLRWLVEDPRMSISDVASRTGLTARRVGRTIQQLMDKGIMFSVRWNLSAGGYDQIMVRTLVDEKKMAVTEVAEWVRERFPTQFWLPYISADEPIVFLSFVVQNMQEANHIAQTLKQADFVKSTIVSVRFQESKFPWMGHTMIQDMVREAGFYDD